MCGNESNFKDSRLKPKSIFIPKPHTGMSNNLAEKEKIERIKPDLDRYFDRIHYHGQRTPTLKTLQHIHLLHPKHIPFENLNPYLRIPVKLDLASLENKMLAEKRGGYCFEQNLLLKAVLESLGFRVKGLAARVLWGQQANALTARGHMLLLIEVDSRQYIADVGFGGQTLTAPLLLETEAEQETPHETFRLLQAGDGYRMETLIHEHWKPVYQFGLQEHFLVDYEVTSWYLSNHPASHFVTGLIAARTENDRRYALRNNELAVHHLNGQTEKRLITEAGDLQKTLADTFGIEVPDTPLLGPALHKIVRNR